MTDKSPSTPSSLPELVQGQNKELLHPHKKETKTRNILIVGDWFIDENWIVTSESSPTSSHVGIKNYRSRLDNVEAQLLSLCGAGMVARLLHGSISREYRAENLEVNIYGLGQWEPTDTHFISALFRSSNTINYQTPLTLQGMHSLNPKESEPRDSAKAKTGSFPN